VKPSAVSSASWRRLSIAISSPIKPIAWPSPLDMKAL
jgi:hypothetical protein